MVGCGSLILESNPIPWQEMVPILESPKFKYLCKDPCFLNLAWRGSISASPYRWFWWLSVELFTYRSTFITLFWFGQDSFSSRQKWFHLCWKQIPWQETVGCGYLITWQETVPWNHQNSNIQGWIPDSWIWPEWGMSAPPPLVDSSNCGRNYLPYVDLY